MKTYKPNLDIVASVGAASDNVHVQQDYMYDALGRRTSTVARLVNPTPGVIYRRGYEYNRAGQRTSESIQYPASSIPDPLAFPDSYLLQYGYDNMGQLTNAYKFRDSVKQKDYMHEIRGRISSGALMERTETSLE